MESAVRQKWKTTIKVGQFLGGLAAHITRLIRGMMIVNLVIVPNRSGLQTSP